MYKSHNNFLSNSSDDSEVEADSNEEATEDKKASNEEQDKEVTDDTKDKKDDSPEWYGYMDKVRESEVSLVLSSTFFKYSRIFL